MNHASHTTHTTVLLLILVLTGCTSMANLFSGSDPIQENRGKRTFGSFIDDAIIETKARVNVPKADPEFKGAHIVITSFNGSVLLAGQVRSEHLRLLAETTVKKIRKIKHVYNELTVSGPISSLARSNDAWLTTKIKSRMLATKGFDSNRTKVVTENGIVFLMGLVTHAEAEKAVQIVRQVHGVQKIIKVYEYI